MTATRNGRIFGIFFRGGGFVVSRKYHTPRWDTRNSVEQTNFNENKEAQPKHTINTKLFLKSGFSGDHLTSNVTEKCAARSLKSNQPIRLTADEE